MVRYFKVLYFILIAISGYSQTDTNSIKYINKSDTRFDEIRLIYRKQNVFSAIVHTKGLGFNYRHYNVLNATQKTFYNIEWVTLKHPKEVKITTFNTDARGYVYGKKNDVSILSGSFGYEKIKHEKQSLNGVQISLNYSIGPSIAILKPVYLEIAYPYLITGARKVIEQYDETKHSQSQIFGKANVFYGLDKLRFLPGLNVKAAVQFEYSKSDEYVRAIEIGLRSDIFLKDIPIMAIIDNNFAFLNIFACWQFGKKIK